MRFPRVFPAAAVLATAAAYFFGAGLDGWWPLVWFAPVPVLVFASGASARSAAAAAFAAWLLGGLNLVSYLAMVMPPVAVAAVLLLPAAAFALAVLAHRRAALGLPAWAAPLSFPAAWTAWEWLLAQVSPHGTAGSIAYSQAEFLPLLQAASVAGIWGVTFVVALAASGLAAALRSRAAVPLVAPLCVLALALGYGYGRLAHPVPGREITVGLAATDSTLRYFDTEDPRRALAVAADYARRIAELGARKARVVVLPEKFVGVTAADAAQVRDVLAAAARSAGVAVVAGLNDVGSRPLRNTAVVFSSSGAVIAEYDKARLLPGPETPYAAGAHPGAFQYAGIRWGVAICKDMDFPEWIRRYRGISIMLVPAWDFVRDARLHARMAVVRGVEGGFAMARSAQQGRLTVSDHRGRVLAETSTSGANEALLAACVRAGPGRTFYQATGDWLPVCCVIATAVLAVARRRIRYNTQHA